MVLRVSHVLHSGDRGRGFLWSAYVYVFGSVLHPDHSGRRVLCSRYVNVCCCVLQVSHTSASRASTGSRGQGVMCCRCVAGVL